MAAKPLQLELNEEANPRKPLWLWEHPRDDRLYVIGADAAEGNDDDESDFCAAEVLDAYTGVQVAEYHARNIDPIEFGFVLNRLGQFYGGPIGYALIIPEVLTQGATTTRVLLEHLNYPNVWRQRPNLKLIKNYQGVFRDLYGWVPHGNQRDILINEAKAFFRKWPETIRSPRLMSEFKTFRYHRVGQNKDQWKADHAPKKKSDLLFAWMLAVHGRNFCATAMPLKIEREKKRAMSPSEAYNEWVHDRTDRLIENVSLQRKICGRIDPSVPIKRWLYS